MTREAGSTETAAEVEVMRRFEAMARERSWSEATRGRAEEAWSGSATGDSTDRTVSPEHVAAAVAALVAHAVAEGQQPLLAPAPVSPTRGGASEDRPPAAMTATELARVIARRTLPGGSER